MFSRTMDNCKYQAESGRARTHYEFHLLFCNGGKYSSETHVFAADTWEGDSQAGYYTDTVFKSSESQRIYHNKVYIDKETFSKAAKYFGKESIDMIHIDGLHTFEAVSKEYNEWKVKLKRNGTLLFHDTNVRSEDFGVWKLWEEIKKDKEFQCVELLNGYGLGIATWSEQTPRWHKELMEVQPALKTKGRLLSSLQGSVDELSEMKKKIEVLEKHCSNLELIRSNHEKTIEAMIARRKRIYKLLEWNSARKAIYLGRILISRMVGLVKKLGM